MKLQKVLPSFFVISILLMQSSLSVAQTTPQKTKNEQRQSYSVAAIQVLLKEYPDGTVRVYDLIEGGPASKAGMQKGDIFVSVDEVPIKKPKDVRGYLILNTEPGQVADFNMIRKGEKRLIKVVLGSMPVDSDVYEILKLLNKDKKVRLAVLPGKINNTELQNPVQLEQWRNGIKMQLLAQEENRILNFFSEEEGFSLVDRNQVESVLKELKFGATGLVSREARNQLGQLLGLTHIYIVEYSRFGSTDIQTVRIIDVGSGEVLNSYSFRMAR